MSTHRWNALISALTELLPLAIRRNGTSKIQIFFTILATNLLQPRQMLASLVEISCLDIIT
jgi:hypothetical protein